jgi:hypothetical protein
MNHIIDFLLIHLDMKGKVKIQTPYYFATNLFLFRTFFGNLVIDKLLAKLINQKYFP